MPMSPALAPAQTQSLPPVSRLLVGFGLLLAEWEQRQRTRRALERLDAHLLKDVGLDGTAAQNECQKPAWQG